MQYGAMILLRDPAILFLKPHKVAGTSFEVALAQFAAPGDIVTPIGSFTAAERAGIGTYKPANFRYRITELASLPTSEWRRAWQRQKWPARFRSHTSAAEAYQRLSGDDWTKSTKVSIVRNPYDVAVSAYFWMRRPDESFARFWLENPHLLGRNQSKYLVNGEDVIDLYLRYEHIEDDIAGLETRFSGLAGLGCHFRSLRMKSGHRPPGATRQSLFAEAPAVRKLVEKYCAFEIECFGYTPD